eukprot:642213-Rhodomonas_salina.1
MTPEARDPGSTLSPSFLLSPPSPLSLTFPPSPSLPHFPQPAHHTHTHTHTHTRARTHTHTHAHTHTHRGRLTEGVQNFLSSRQVRAPDMKAPPRVDAAISRRPYA